MSTFKLKRGEVGKAVEFTIRDEAGALVDLTGKTAFFTVKRGSTTLVNLGECTNRNQTTARGQCVYVFGSEVSTATAGTYQGELCVVDESGNKLFFPNAVTASRDFITVIVSEPLAIPA